jgi:hypothetical protein
VKSSQTDPRHVFIPAALQDLSSGSSLWPVPPALP